MSFRNPAAAGRTRPNATRARSVALVVAAAVLVPACNSGAPSTLRTRGPAAARIANLWWIMFGISVAVVAVVAVLIVVALVRRRRRTDPREEPRWALGLVLGGGVVFPAVVLTTLWVLTLRDMAALSQPATAARLTVEVVGHRWWWEVRYPDRGVVTANEVRIPAGEPVLIRLSTDDVLHSFWVPELSGKTDLIAGRTNAMTLRADRPGVFRGQCAEFCGLQHAQMIFFVIAQDRADFDAWIAGHRQAPAPPTDPLLRQGREVFETHACAACHTIRGTSATGAIGPDLTDLGGRLTLGAGAVENTRGSLGGWIVDSQTIKPGNLMPPMEVSPADLNALIAYLESLK